MFLDCSRQIADNPARDHFGIAAADLDGDGVIELIIAGHRCGNRVLKWVDGALLDCADPAFADQTGGAFAVAAADVDGDGREEIYILNADGADRLFACFGEKWLDLLAQADESGVDDPAAGRSVAALDRTGGGRYGFLVSVEGGAPRLLELNRRGRLADAAEEAGLDQIGAGRGVTALALLAEHMDVVVCNEAGPNFLFRNLGDGTFEEIAAECGLADPWPAARAVAPVDTGDGRLSLLLANWEGPQRFFIQRSGPVFVDAAGADLSLPGRVGTVIAADFDNDGRQELFFNLHGEPNRLFGWRGDEWRELDLGDATEAKDWGTGAVVADVDGDGRLELVIAHGGAEPGPLTLYRPMPNENHWFRVMPLTAFGAPARGAIVHLYADGRQQTRAICAGSGYLCQMEPVAHFGLGAVDRIERIDIQWPDGAVATVGEPPVDRLLTIPYPPE